MLPKVAPTFLTILSCAQLLRVDICMFILRAAVVVTLQIYTGVLLRTSVEFSIGAFIDI